MVLANPYLPVLMGPAGQQDDPNKITGANVGQYDLNDVGKLYEQGGEQAIMAKYGADSIANIRSQVTGMSPPAPPQAPDSQQPNPQQAMPQPTSNMGQDDFGAGSRQQLMPPMMPPIMPPMMGMGMGGMMPMMGMNPMMGMGIGACPPQSNEPLAYYQQQS